MEKTSFLCDKEITEILKKIIEKNIPNIHYVS